MSEFSARTPRAATLPNALNDLSFWIEERLSRRPRSVFGQGLRISLITIHAMILREAVTRYGSRSAGFVWALVEPLMQLTVLVLFFTYFRRREPTGDSMVIFFLTGIIPLLIFRGALARGAGALTGGSLTAYRQVGPFEIITSRMILEFVIFSGVIAIVIVAMKAFLGLPVSSWLSEPLKFLAAMGAFFILSYGVCYLSAQIGRVFSFWSTIVGLSGRILFFTSGMWFTIGSLPPTIQPYVKYNPLAQIIEWIRDGVISGFDSDLYNVMYPLQFGVICLAVGLFMGWLVRIGGYETPG